MRIAKLCSALVVPVVCSACSGTVSIGSVGAESTPIGGAAGSGGALLDASAGGAGGSAAADAAPDVSWFYPSTVSVGAAVPAGDQSGARKLIIENHCTYTVWADAIPISTMPNNKPLKLESGQAFQLTWPQTGWSGRIWGRTRCSPAADGSIPFGNCIADTLNANSLIELTMGDPDFYDISLVDGFNAPIGLIVIGQALNPADIYNCGSPVCAKDLLRDCPASQQRKDSTGNTIACRNGQNLGDVTRWFKARCPTSSTYPSYDSTGKFTCRGYPSYTVSFCPAEGVRAGFP
jgi:hypothetical protein